MLKQTLKAAIDFFLQVFFFFGKAIATPYYSLKKKDKSKIEPKKILVLHFDGSKIGDAVLSTVIFPALKESFPKAELYAMYNSLTNDIVENNPFIKKIFVAKHFNFFRFLEMPIGFKLRKEKFGVCISMTHNFSSHAIAFLCGAKCRIGWDRKGSGFLLNCAIPYPERGQRRIHEVENYLKLLEPLGIKNSNAKPLLFSSEQAENKILELLEKNGFKKGSLLLGMHAGSTQDALAKRWPAENFSRLAEKLIESKNAFVVLVGANYERALNEHIISGIGGKFKKNVLNLAGQISILELIALAKKASAFVCNDSAPMHVAAAAGCYTIALFGPTDERLFSPVGKTKIITSKISCRPCYTNIKKWMGRQAECKINECMKKITVKEVFKAVKNAVS